MSNLIRHQIPYEAGISPCSIGQTRGQPRECDDDSRQHNARCEDLSFKSGSLTSNMRIFAQTKEYPHGVYKKLLWKIPKKTAFDGRGPVNDEFYTN